MPMAPLILGSLGPLATLKTGGKNMEENIRISESSQDIELESKDSLAEMKEYLRKPVLLENLASGTEVCLRCGKNEWKLKLKSGIDCFIAQCAGCGLEKFFECWYPEGDE